jgi:hypothetical protein
LLENTALPDRRANLFCNIDAALYVSDIFHVGIRVVSPMLKIVALYLRPGGDILRVIPPGCALQDFNA